MNVAHAFGALALLVACASAHAHATLDHAQPRVGSTVQAAPSEVSLWFTERIEPAFSTAKVVDAAGVVVSQAKAQVDRADPTRLRVALPKLPPGTYKVVWRIVSLDTHVTQGDFVFKVAP